MADVVGAQPEVQVVVDRVDSSFPVVRLTGELDTMSAETVRTVLDEVVSTGPERIAFDLFGLTFMDSSGIALLLSARQAAPVELRGASSAIQRVIEASGLAGVFELTPEGVRAAQRFEAGPASVAAARRFVTQQLTGVTPEAIDTVAVMVSELATNAVQHSRTDFDLSVELGQDRLRVEVADSGVGQPELRQPSPEDLRGRGLQIVRTLSDAWGVTPRPQGAAGKVVWFEFALPRG